MDIAIISQLVLFNLFLVANGAMATFAESGGYPGMYKFSKTLSEIGNTGIGLENLPARGVVPALDSIIVAKQSRARDINEDTKRHRIPDRIDIQETLRNEDLYNLKAEAFYHQGLRERSVEMWELLLNDEPNHRPSLNNLAIAHFNARRYESAEELFLRLIQNDPRPWLFPNARFYGPLAYYKQYGELEEIHAILIEEFLSSNPPQYRAHAEKLKSFAVNRVISTPVSMDKIRFLRKKIEGSEQNIIHFWAEWCEPCINELTDLFEFRNQYPKIQILIVSIDAEQDKHRADKKLNQLFSPYKSHEIENLRFVSDAKKLLWKTYVPPKEQQVLTVPRTVFLNRAEAVRYTPRAVDWASLDPEVLWNSIKH